VLKIKYERDGFYIHGPPLAIRSNKFLTMSRPWLDWITNVLFPKDWFYNVKPPEEEQLNDCLIKTPGRPVVLFRSDCVLAEVWTHFIK
jgi:hypothetical protein